MTAAGEKTIGVTAFRRRSLELIEEVATGKVRRVILTKRGKPVAAIVPLEEHGIESLRGCLKHLMDPVPGVDLTEPTGEVWDAELA